ncbi:MAG: endonuclease MutS2 [Clostridia bacterium]
MQQRVLKTLEYDKIAAMVAQRTVCCVGAQLAQKLRPETNFEQIERQMQLTAEAHTLLYRTGSSPIDDFPDMRSCIKKAHAALYLSAGELLGIAKCLRAARVARELLVKGDEAGLLRNMATNLIAHRSVEEEIARCIISEDEIFDGASPELSRIRRSMRIANERVRERLNNMIHSATYQKYLQEPLITIRNGRFVIPVKQEYRQNVPGLIHDQSGSGATLFIEPNAVVELGNEYKKLVLQESDEIERILTELTALLIPYADDVYNNLELMGELDLIFAKAKLARELSATAPKLNTSGFIRIVRGRHPLISRDTVVPIDVWVGDDFRTLIITGPNTGGKTVTLKTVGLFTLMAQSGMFIPADEGSEIAIFDEVYADIGDEQSIEQSLSTFSSHMTNIVTILNQADERSLVLLDELGAGTDPNEGAALAMSILDELYVRRTTCLATTHYSEIKAFALTREGMENASMEFDVDRLCPTYRLFIGIPGKSNAFEISGRLGLSDHIIEGARRFLKGEDVRFEDVISSAESQRKRAEQERFMAEKAREELDKLRSEAEAERKKLLEDRTKQITKAKDEARRLVADTKREMEKLIVAVRSIKGVDMSAADRVIQQSRDAMRAQEAKLSEPLKKQAEDAGKSPKSVKPGDSVRITTLDKQATVLSCVDAKGEVQVQAGIIKLNVKLDELRLIEEKPMPGGGVRTSLPANRSVGLELDIRGMLVDDAIPVVDRYLDDAALAGLSEVNVIHGKGTGALRSGIQAHLRFHPRVKGFRLGNYGEGDAGVTVITLR